MQLFQSLLRKTLRFSFYALLVATLMFNAFGTQFVFWKLNRLAKTEMRVKLSKNLHASEISTLTFAKSSPPNLIDEGKEILLHGSKYDIVSIQPAGDSVRYYCVYDKAETKILAEYKRSFLHDEVSTKRGVPLKNILKNLLQEGELKPTEKNSDNLALSEIQYAPLVTSAYAIVILQDDPPPKA